MIRCTQCGSNNPIFNTHCSECESVLTFPETSYDPQDERLQESSFDENASKDISSKESKPKESKSKESTAKENTSEHSKTDNSYPHHALEIDDLQVKSDVSNTESIAEFSIIKKIGEGGMGKVFLAKDTVLNRKVALKTLSEEKLSPKMTQRIIEEARLASVLNHDNIATVYSASNSGSIPYIAMEWVEGESLEHGIFQEKFTYQQSLNIAAQIAKALKHAHAHGIIHRDIKPANIMVCRNTGKVKVLDFGIAERFQADHISAPIEQETSVNSRQTSLGILEGTIAYMSPEQTQQKTLSLASDVFSFGIVLHELMTGDNPFEAETVKSTLNNIQQKNDFDPSLKGLPGELKKLIIDCLSKTPEQRPAFEQIELILNKLHRAEVDRTLKNRSYWTSSWRLPAIITGLIFLVASSAFYLLKPILSDRDHILAQGKKIAVLPFENVSADPQIDIFSKGLTADLNLSLSKMSRQNNSWVIPAAELAKIKDPTVENIYKKHNVDLVISGSVQHLGAQRRLIINLLNAQDTRVIDSFYFDFSVDETFQTQSKVKQAIAQLMGWELDKDNYNTLPISESYQHYLSGLAYLYRYDSKGNIDKAIQSFQKMLELQPEFNQALLQITQAYIRKLKHDSDREVLDKAIEYANKALEQSPSSTTYALLGMVNYKKSLYEKAKSNFKQAIELDKANSNAYLGLGRVYQAQGDNRLAEEAFVKAVSIDENWIYWNYIAYFYYQTNQLEKAEKAYGQVARMTPDNIYGHQMKGAIALARGRYEAAIVPFKKSIKVAPSNANNYSNLATTYFYLKEYSHSINYFEKAISLNSKSFVLYANLADAYRWLPDPERARNNYQKAIELISNQIKNKPNSRKLAIRKSSYLAKSGQIRKAIKLLESGDSVNDHYMKILSAQIYEISGKRQKAVSILKELIVDGYDYKNIENEPEFHSLLNDERSQLFN